MTLEEVNALSDEGFIEAFGSLYEHSPWIAAMAAKQRPFTSITEMLAQLDRAVQDAPEADQLELLRAHPELAGKAAIDGSLTHASKAEQASAGLDRMLPDEFHALTEMNAAYGAKFGFPFIICVRLTNKAGILAALKQRLTHSRAEEFKTALEEVRKIAKLRLEGILS